MITEIANKFNKPICILGCGVGNTLSRKARKHIAKVLNSASFIALRDLYSADRLKPPIKNNTSLNVSPDLAFALNLSVSNSKASKPKKRVLDLNIMPLSIFKKYNPKLEDLNNRIYIAFRKRLAL